jgi:hypothetical protein
LFFLHSARNTGGLSTVNNDSSSATDSKDLRAKVSQTPSSLVVTVNNQWWLISSFISCYCFSWHCIACGATMSAVYLDSAPQNARAKVFDDSHGRKTFNYLPKKA